MKVIPGMMLDHEMVRDAPVGEGLYRLNGQVYASQSGCLVQQESDGTWMVSPPTISVPTVGQTVLAIATKLTTRFVALDIRVIECQPQAIYLQEPFKGTLRQNDLWPSTDRNAPTQIYQSIRPGDLVRCRIIGIGDASAGFLLSTALDESLGVVYALAAVSGQPLVPIAWNEMICPVTGVHESRKPARPPTAPKHAATIQQ